MGRFYETSEPHFVDNKMYEAPAELMSKVLMNKEKAVDDTISSAEAYLEKLKAEALTQDTPALQQRIKDYEGKISGIVSNIQANPMEYHKYQNDITKLGRDISADWTTGAIGTMQLNKKKAEAEVAKLDDHLKLHPEDAEYVGLMKKGIFAEYGEGLKWNDKTNKAEASLAVDGTYYHPEFDDKFITQMKAKGYAMEKDTVSGMWINTTSTDNKTLTQKEIQQAYIAGVKADPNYQTALSAWSKAGVSGYEDVDVNKIYTPRLDKNGNPVLDKKGQEIQDLSSSNFFAKKALAAGIALEQREIGGKSTKQANGNYWSEKDWEAKNRELEIQENLITGISKTAGFGETNANGQSTTRNQAELDIINKQWGNSLQSLGKSAGLSIDLGDKISIGTVRDQIKSMKKYATSDSAKAQVLAMENKLKVLQSTYRTTLPSGYPDMAPAFGVEATKDVQKQMASYTKDPGNVYNVKQDWKIYSKKLGRALSFKNITFYEIAGNPTKYGLTPQDFASRDETPTTGIAAEAGSKGGKQTPRIPNYLIEGSDRPVILSTEEGDWDKNKINFDFEVNGVSLQSSATFGRIGLKKVIQ